MDEKEEGVWTLVKFELSLHSFTCHSPVVFGYPASSSVTPTPFLLVFRFDRRPKTLKVLDFIPYLKCLEEFDPVSA